MRLLVTGGAGFIGCNFVRYMLGRQEDCEITVLDKLTYAGNLESLDDVWPDPRFRFVLGDVCDRDVVRDAIEGHDAVVHFAAETHVDRSILYAGDFITTDVFGTFVMLECAREAGVRRFIHISTDEVYGSIAEGAFDEDCPLKPTNPYAASKAGADRLAFSFFATYGLAVVITRCSNNFGPYQYPEKMIPLFTTNALEDKPLPVYGTGRNVRDWIHVRDHCAAIALLLEKGQSGEVYNIGAGNERSVLEIASLILDELRKPQSLIQFVKDRPGHDLRYCLVTDKLRALGWAPRADFERELRATVRWYVENEAWWRKVRAKSEDFLRKQYGTR
jgi:dTDP-glucose 4,6-dehydratase